MYKRIEVTIDDDVAVLRLNDSTRLNAISFEMLDEINLGLDQIAGRARALVLTGAGRSFCSGAALDGGLGEYNPDLSQRDFGAVLESHINPLMSRLRNLDIPWISAVRGAAAGAGAPLALAADMVLASDNAFFMQAFSRIGLVADAGATYLLVRAIGRVRAMELMMLGERLPAQKALEWGLVNRVVADAELDGEALALARRLAQGPGVALGLMRKAAWQAQDADWETMLQGEREWQRDVGKTEDAEEGRLAFLEKRAPLFKGR